MCEYTEVMRQGGHGVPTYSILSILQDCIKKKDIETGRKVSDLITKFGLDTDPFLGTHLIRLFALGGSLLEAQKVFHHLSEQSEFSWSAIISAHAKLGKDREAVGLYEQMRDANVNVDAHTFVAVLTACSHVGALHNGRIVHVNVIQDGYDSSLFVSNSLISMYSKHGNLDDATRVFERLQTRDTVSFSALISGYTWHGPGEEALRFFTLMQQEGMKPDKVIVCSILNVCSSLKALDMGKIIHSLLTDDDLFIQSALVDMYATCGSLIRARELFNKFSAPCLVTWNAMISGYAQHGHGQEALELFTYMKQKEVEHDIVTHLSIIKAGSCIGHLGNAHVIHAHIVETCHENNVPMENSLIDLYAKCDCLEDARKVFDKVKQRTVVTWNVWIAACTQLGSGQEGLHYYQSMLYGGIDPDSGTFVSALKASLRLSAVDQGRTIHANIMEKNQEKNLLVGNTLVDMYVKFGKVEDACWVFDNMPQRDVVTWTAVMDGLAQRNRYDKVKQYFTDMQRQGVKPNSITFLCLLSACNHMGLVDEGRSSFKMMKEMYNISPTLQHYSCMVDLLARGGLPGEAEELLHIMPSEFSSVARTCLLSQCTIQHNEMAGKRCFEQLVFL